MLRALSDRWIPSGAAATIGAATIALALLLGPADVRAQDGVIAGQVVDASTLQPLGDVQVFLPGLEVGTLTDPAGSFRITGVPSGRHTVQVRLIGYLPVSRAITVEPGRTVETMFRLEISAVAMEEVVVTATGERRRREVGNAISTVDASTTVERSNPDNLTSLLKGQSPGVTVQRSSGSVGTGATLKIRGNTSISLDNTPLIYVDGVRVSNTNDADGAGVELAAVGGQDFSRLNDLNPEDIESIEVIKGPAAAALYGVEAAAGVIRVATKRGRTGETIYTLRAQGSLNWDDTDWPTNAWHPQSFLGSEVDVGALLLGAPGALGPPVPVPDTLYGMNLLEGSLAPDFGEVFRDPFRSGEGKTLAAAARGGSESVSYYLSGEWEDDRGNLPNNDLQRWSARANFDLQPSDEVNISVSSGFSSHFTNLPGNDNNIFGFIGVALVSFPWERPVVREDPVTGETLETCPFAFEIARASAQRLPGTPLLEALTGPGGVCGGLNPFFSDRTFGDVATIDNSNDIERFTGSGTLTYVPWDFLTNRLTIGYDQFSERLSNLFPVDPELPHGELSRGFRFLSSATQRNLTLEGTSSLNLDLTRDLNSQFTVGGQWFRNTRETAQAQGSILPAGTSTVSNAASTLGFEGFVETRTAGFFFQEQLGWKDRVFVTPSIRFDDNSAFGANLGLQALPSVNSSYLISEEAWFPEVFDQLRLRAAWGRSGLQPGPFAALELLNATRTTFEGRNLVGVSPLGATIPGGGGPVNQGPGNPELRPETGEEWEFGFDTSVLDGRLALEATYYRQRTRDAITASNLAPSLGFPGPVVTNVGEVVNRGFEFGLDANAISIPNLSWDWRFSLTTNKGEITELDSPIQVGLDAFFNQEHREGFPFAAYFEEPVFLDADGEVVVGDDAVFLGHPTPEWDGSLSTTVSLFEHVTLFGLLDFSGGHQLVNGTEQFLCSFLGGGSVGGTCLANYETRDGVLTDEARIKQVASGAANLAPWIEDADFARIRTVSLGLELPEAWATVLRSRSASLRVVAENLGVWTGYSGVDPELNGAGQDGANFFEFLTLPPSRRVSATLRLRL
jgi:TonB-dependent SusC/RagA subfamily outer membrane receptor